MGSLFTPWEGAWRGVARTWLRPDVPEDTADITSEVRIALDGSVAVHEYTSSMHGKPLHGVAQYAREPNGRMVMTWFDTFHTGGALMTFTGDGGEDFSVLGSYGDGQGGPDWGWRVTITVPEPGRLLVVHDNITPEGQVARAVEMDHLRA